MLDGFPNEILCLIFQKLATSPRLMHVDDDQHYDHHRDNWETLARLCRVSQRMRYFAEPSLYRNYSKPDSAWNVDEHYRFRRFLTIVLGRPELLHHVRSLYIGSWRHEGYDQLGFEFDEEEDEDDDDEFSDDHEELEAGFPNGLLKLYSEYAETSALSDVWRRALKTGDEAAEITLLISLTPNLEHIEFCMPDLSLVDFTAPQYFWPSLLVPSSEWDHSRHFSRLNSVVVHRKDSRNLGNAGDVFGFEIGSFLSFIELPRLKVFWVVDDGRCRHLEHLENYPLNGQDLHLTDLILGISYIDPVKVLQILRRCTKLEAFDCDFQQQPRLLIPGFSWYNIREALISSRNTLEVLRLDAHPKSQLHWEETCVSIGPLPDFTSLKILDVTQTTLLGFEMVYEDLTLAVPALPFEEMLPSSLESLTIHRCSFTIVPYLEAISTKLKDRFPHLQVIELGEINLAEDSLYIDLAEKDLDQYPQEEHDTVMQGRKNRVKNLKEDFVAAGVQWL